jgi:hypothetical protein
MDKIKDLDLTGFILVKNFKCGNSPREIIDGQRSGQPKLRSVWFGQKTSLTVDGRRSASNESNEVFSIVDGNH